VKLTFEHMLSEHIPVIFDGAMGTELQKENLSADDFEGKTGCNEILNVRRPDIVRGVHARYLSAGAHVIETNTFGGNRFKLAEYGLEHRVREINFAGAQCAREAVESACGGCAFVCGAMGPTGFLPSSSDPAMSRYGFAEIEAAYAEQAEALLEGGVDLLLLETMQDLLETRAAMLGVGRAFEALKRRVPLQVQITMDVQGRMLLGSDIAAFLGAVANLSPAVIGLNCGSGPDEMRPAALALAAQSPYPISMIPNAGMPENADGRARYTMDAAAFARSLANMVTIHGVGVVGGCCGTTSEHISRLAELLKGTRVAARTPVERPIFCATTISGVAIHRCDRPVIIGERLNAQGSAATKKLVLARNTDELVRIAEEQQERGARLLDICMAMNERDDEAQTVAGLVRALRDRVHTPFCIDTTDPAVIEQAMLHCPGSALINSVNLEKNGDKARRILAAARRFGCPVIALPIDDAGTAREVERKVELAGRLRELIHVECGLPEHFIFFDPLVFTLATGERAMANAAVDSLEALRRVKKRWPSMHTVMGVSNVSFGLTPRARRIINNLMLYHAALAGLDAAIFNPLHLDNVDNYDPEARRLCEDLLFNRTDGALAAVVDYFERQSAKPEVKEKTAVADPRDELRQKIFRRDRRGLRELIETLLQGMAAHEILNAILLPAMADVGERMARGEMILPFVLQAAEVMKEAAGILEPHFGTENVKSKGKIVLATVNGDIHDIGKNLVGSILKNQGYEVADLGKSVPNEEILSAVERERPDALGLSALLVTTSREMEGVVALLHSRKSRVPIIIGGAAVNRRFAERIALVNGETAYAGGVYYGRDAFDAAKVLDQARGGPAQIAAAESRTAASAPPEEEEPMPAPPAVTHEGIITPLFFGTGEMLVWDSRRLLAELDRRELYKGYWRTAGLDDEAFERAVMTEFDPAFEALRQEIEAKNIVNARGYYGIWPVYADGETVYLLDPSDFSTEVAHFIFPRVRRKQGRSIADWIRPEGDVIGLQVVTLGGALAARSREYFEREDKYSRGFFLNGIGNYLTEIIADKVTAEIRRAMFLPDKKQGRRYGFGYPGLPGLEKQKDLLDLLCAEDRLGITLTSGYQMAPEHSTVTIFVHHPDAQYL